MSYHLIGAGDILSSPSVYFVNAELVTFDAENVLTDYGDYMLRKGVLEMLEDVTRYNRYASRHVAIATNNRSAEYVDGLVDQLPGHIPVFSGLQYANKKSSPAMFEAAAEYFGVDPRNCIHVDDQFLSHRGARQAHFAGGLLVRPFGSTDHYGVKAGRIIDQTVRAVARSGQLLRSIVTDGIDG